MAGFGCLARIGKSCGRDVFASVPLSFAIFLALGAFPGFAQSPSDDFLKRLYQDSDVLQEQAHIIRSAQEDVELARAGLLPDVYLEAGVGAFTRKRTGLASSDNRRQDDTYANVLLHVSQTLWNGGRNRHEIASREAAKTAEEHHYRHLQQTTFMNAVKARLNVTHRKAVLALATESLSFVRKHLRDERERFELGAATLTELSRVLAHAREKELELETAREQLVRALIVQEKFLGSDESAEVDLSSSEQDLPKTADEAVRLAMKNSALISSDDALINAARHALEKTKAETLPTVSLDGFLSAGRSPFHEFEDVAAIGVTVRIPLSGAATSRSKKAKSSAELARRKLQRDETLRDLEERVRIVFQAHRVAGKKLALIRKARIDAENSVKLALEERDFDLMTTPEMLKIYDQMLQVRQRELELERALSLSRVVLATETGGVPLMGEKSSAGMVPVPVQNPAKKRLKDFSIGGSVAHAGLGLAPPVIGKFRQDQNMRRIGYNAYGEFSP